MCHKIPRSVEQRALNEITKTNMREHHASVIWDTQNGRIITWGYNQVTFNDQYSEYKHKDGSTLKKRFWFSTCAEKSALSKIKPYGKKNKQFALLVIRIQRSGNIVFSKPCKSCQDQIKKYRLKTVFYSDENGNYQRLRV